MILEGHLSMQQGTLGESELAQITNYIQGIYDKIEIPDQSELFPLMLQDKKNLGSQLSFSLLKGIGDCLYDQQVSKGMIEEALRYYRELK
jgi:3-dehydroquinate synthase